MWTEALSTPANIWKCLISMTKLELSKHIVSKWCFFLNSLFIRMISQSFVLSFSSSLSYVFSWCLWVSNVKYLMNFDWMTDRVLCAWERYHACCHTCVVDGAIHFMIFQQYIYSSPQIIILHMDIPLFFFQNDFNVSGRSSRQTSKIWIILLYFKMPNTHKLHHQVQSHW